MLIPPYYAGRACYWRLGWNSVWPAENELGLKRWSHCSFPYRNRAAPILPPPPLRAAAAWQWWRRCHYCQESGKLVVVAATARSSHRNQCRLKSKFDSLGTRQFSVCRSIILTQMPLIVRATCIQRCREPYGSEITFKTSASLSPFWQLTGRWNYLHLGYKVAEILLLTEGASLVPIAGHWQHVIPNPTLEKVRGYIKAGSGTGAALIRTYRSLFVAQRLA